MATIIDNQSAILTLRRTEVTLCLEFDKKILNPLHSEKACLRYSDYILHEILE